MTQAPSSTSGSGRRIQVRQSGIHGKGVYAVQPIAAGDTVIEYKGEIITWEEALDRHPHDPEQPNHTFYFHLDDGHVIDGKYNGNSALASSKRSAQSPRLWAMLSSVSTTPSSSFFSRLRSCARLGSFQIVGSSSCLLTSINFSALLS